MTIPLPSRPALQWQPEKRLQSQDRLWILTDTYSEWRSYKDGAAPQLFYRVGCYDLTTDKIGYVRFSKDDARGLLRAGLPSAPWPSGLSKGIYVKRMAHGGGEEKGRFKVEVTLIEIEPDIAWVAPIARDAFRRDGHWPNATRDMWKKMADRVALERAIETAALSMVGVFKAADVKAIVGDINVSPVLKRLVEERRLVPVTPKTYRVAPPKMIITERADWTS